MPSPDALVVDLQPAIEVAQALDALTAAWARCPPPIRKSLARLVWLHPDGEVVVYRPPEP